MSKEEFKDISSGKRLLYLREIVGDSQAEAARSIGISLSSLQRYEYGILPGRRNVKKIQDHYKCNETWLLTGEGVAFPNISDKVPEIDATKQRVTESRREYKTRMGQRFSVEETTESAHKVLLSGTPYAAALRLNIIQFDSAPDADLALKICREEIAEPKTQVGKLQGQVDRLTAVPAIAADSGDSTD